ncbi:MAG: BatD family protein [Legionellales bacterium]|nr:BatD family protein [Legionellales bacterium]
MSAWAAGISVDLDATQIELGRQVSLTLTYDPGASRGTPDLSALQTDFNILATQQSMSYSLINGQARSIGQWRIVLEPKHAGLITIPAIHIGSLSSTPMQLNVSHVATPAPAAKDVQDGAPHPDTTLLVTVDSKTPYLHQEVLYKVRLETRSRLADVRYQAPQVDNAILFPLGTGQESQMTRDGVVYHVDEQTYAVFPQKSGPLLITPPTLHALSYDFAPKPVSVTGDRVALEVKPLPKHTVRSTWLPSKLVRLQEHYDQAETQLKQGATVVRTIELQAQGLVAQLLPEIPFPENADLRTYADQAERDTRIQQGELWGRSKVKLTYVFPKAGKVVLPAIHLPWFNVKTQKMEMAELPAKPYDILSSDSEPAVKPKPKPLLPPKAQPVTNAPVEPMRPAVWEWKPILVMGGALGIGASVLGLLFVLLRWRWRGSKPYRDLRAACKTNDIEATKLALVVWGNQQWAGTDMTHFTQILPLLREQDVLRTALQEFMTVLYHPKATVWQGAALWRAIQAFKKYPEPKSARAQIVPAMHPTRK